jgi:hypothetical protein
MALDSATGSELDIAGAAPSRPTYINKIQFDGDAAYATGGSADFEQFVHDVTDDIVTVVSVEGYGYNAAFTAMTHFVRYDKANDKLQVHLLAGAEVGGAVDLSSFKFELTVTGQ